MINFSKNIANKIHEQLFSQLPKINRTIFFKKIMELKITQLN